MADGRNSPTAPQSTPLWREIFRGFQIALDPRKLLLAAGGIVAMTAVWWLLSLIFFNLSPQPKREDPTYSNARIQEELGSQTKPGTNEPYREEDLRQIGDERFQADLARWRVLDELAGPGGRLRTMPWYEFRGENPFTFLTRLLGSPPATWGGQLAQYIQTAVPVLLEPLAKILLPIGYLARPNLTPLTRLYLILVLVSSILIWAFFAGVITRIAAIQYTRKGPISLKQALLFVAKRYVGYAGGPLIPLGLIALSVLGLIVYGLLGLIPLFGDLIIFGIGLPLILIAGAVMTFFAIGLVAYPLMFVTLSVEGDQSDALDAVSRAMNYLYSTPWRYIGYWALALLYGAAVTFFVLFFVSLAVYLGKWAVSQTAAGIYSSRQPDYLFIYAPQSFGWRELLTLGSPYAIRLQERQVEGSQRVVFEYVPANPTSYNEAMASFYFYNTWGAGLIGLWLHLIFLCMVGFSYSFFWSASTIIYFLLRKINDEAELDEVYEEELEEPIGMAPPSSPSPPTSGGTISLPMTTPGPAPASPAGSAAGGETPTKPASGSGTFSGSPASPPPASPSDSATTTPPAGPPPPPAPSASVPGGPPPFPGPAEGAVGAAGWGLSSSQTPASRDASGAAPAAPAPPPPPQDHEPVLGSASPDNAAPSAESSSASRTTAADSSGNPPSSGANSLGVPESPASGQ
ncbi:MAG: hypothetical protein WHU94_07910 [Thermogemmata sp.]